MYGDRKLVKDQEIKTRGDSYLIDRIKRYVERTGKQRDVLIRDWITKGLEEDEQSLIESKDNEYITEL